MDGVTIGRSSKLFGHSMWKAFYCQASCHVLCYLMYFISLFQKFSKSCRFLSESVTFYIDVLFHMKPTLLAPEELLEAPFNATLAVLGQIWQIYPFSLNIGGSLTQQRLVKMMNLFHTIYSHRNLLQY